MTAQLAAPHGRTTGNQAARQRKPSLTRLVAKAKQLGVDVTIEPNGTATFRTGSSTRASKSNEWDEVLPRHGKH